MKVSSPSTLSLEGSIISLPSSESSLVTNIVGVRTRTTKTSMHKQNHPIFLVLIAQSQVRAKMVPIIGI
uniref:Uncharacterized protein n=1 Tax=Rhizophora mucronata TaxID=61149 RepID=A0A2P2K4S8_RHIMU